MSRIVALIAAASLAVGALSWLLRDQLFHRDDIWFPVLVAVDHGRVGLHRRRPRRAGGPPPVRGLWP